MTYSVTVLLENVTQMIRMIICDEFNCELNYNHSCPAALRPVCIILVSLVLRSCWYTWQIFQNLAIVAFVYCFSA